MYLRFTSACHLSSSRSESVLAPRIYLSLQVGTGYQSGSGMVEKSGKSGPAAAFSSYLDSVGHFMETQNVNNERDFRRGSEKVCVARHLILQRGLGICATPGPASGSPDPWDKALSLSPERHDGTGEWPSLTISGSVASQDSETVSDTPPPFPGL